MLTPFALALENTLACARSLPPLGEEQVRLSASGGRVLARDLTSGEQIPTYDNSAMDGFALRSASTFRGQRLPVRGPIFAGDIPLPASASPPEAEPIAWEIMTGAPFPAGFDTCVRIEDVKVDREASGRITAIQLPDAIKPRLNRRLAGEDFALGAPVAKRGLCLQAEHLHALASLGFAEISVWKRPRVAIIPTGKELVPLETKPAPGQIRNSNAPYLQAALRTLGADPLLLGTVPDDTAVFRARLEEAEGCELILSTGAVSMGRADFVLDEIRQTGAEILFHKLAVRPAKPLLLARLPSGAIFCGLPGNPVSGMVGLRFLLEPFLRTRLGRAPEKRYRGTLAASFVKPEGIRCFFLARREESESGPRLTVLPKHASFMAQSLGEDLAWVVLKEEGALAEANTPVDFYPFHARLS